MCKKCGRKFNVKLTWQNHQKKTHVKDHPKAYKCQRCDYSTDILKYFKLHQGSHERQDKKYALYKKPIKCGKCSKLFKNKKSLYSHVKTVHPLVLYQCDLCAKYFKEKNKIAKHLNLKVCQKN